VQDGVGGHFHRLMAGIGELAASGKELTIGTVVTRRNLDALGAVARLLQRLRAEGLELHAWHLYRFLPVGRGGAVRGHDLAVDSTEYRRAVEQVRAPGLGFPVYRRDDMLRSSTVEFFWFEGGELKTGSTSGPAAAAG